MQTQTKIYTVTQVNSLVKEALDVSLPGRVTVKGEITGWKQHHSGHCYFSLKDEGSVLPCAMWRPNAAKLKFRPENGLAILATGSVDVYVPQGRYSLVVGQMQPAGVGALQLAYEQMVKKLAAEGLFADEHKQPIPAFPERIGILTSESGAAVHDIADSVHQRWPCTKLYLYPVSVQGEGAAGQIAAAIGDVNRRNKTLRLDLLIVGRGGGSLEDLWAFNEEIVARAIFASQIPIISAVGHEVDVTVADGVADARASTPTKAGVVAVPDMRDVLADLAHQERRLASQARSCLDLSAQHLQTVLASSVFKNPLLPVHHRQQHIDELASELADAVRARLAEGRADLQGLYEQVVKIEPHRLLGRWAVLLGQLQNRSSAALQRRVDRASVRLDQMNTRCSTAFTAVMNNKRMQLTAQAGHLAGLDPRSVLKRGYSITMNKQTGRVVRTPDDIQVGDSMVTELAQEAKIESKVTGKPERRRRPE
jgi:exodeoxyribonuclease VII large subunit